MMETETEIDCRMKVRFISLKKLAKFGTLAALALILGWIHYRYVSTIHENVTHFSHLSETEREMSFYSESAFYYSFYKTMVEERPFIAGISKLMYDQTVEHPNNVNAFNRFNIHPEVVIASLYRYLEPWINSTRQCHTVSRGEGLAPVESCIGIGQPIMFYLEAIWWLAGLTVAVLFLHATALSESILGGLLAAVQYFANHVECTRVQWVPNERENMAMGALLLQAWLMSGQLRGRRTGAFTLQVVIFIVNTICLLFWQFSQFIFLTQIVIFFIMEQLRIINGTTLCLVLHPHFSGLHIAVLLLNGNDMLKTSLYVSFFCIISIYGIFFSGLRIKIQNRFDLIVEAWLVLLRVCIVVCASFYLKKVTNEFVGLQEDGHIWDILFSKFSKDYKNFHSLLYTCSEEFDFLPWKTIKSMIQTLLIPFAALVIFNVVKYSITEALYAPKRKETERKSKTKEKDSDTEDSGIENTEVEKVINEKDDEPVSNDNVVRFLKVLNMDAAVFYNVAQLFVYGVMAALVMRLKLLFTTQLCVVVSLMMNSKYYVIPKAYKKYLPLFWALCMVPLAYKLMINTTEELSYIDEFSNLPLEELLSFIRTGTEEKAAFAGSLPTMAIVLLNTRRAITAHPHYEHLPARQRAYSVMKTYGRFSSHELYQELSKLKASHLIVENNYCYGKSTAGCSLADIWDTEAPAHAHRPRLCHSLLTDTHQHFYPVFANERYAVFRVHDYSVRYMPRSFDT